MRLRARGDGDGDGDDSDVDAAAAATIGLKKKRGSADAGGGKRPSVSGPSPSSDSRRQSVFSDEDGPPTAFKNATRKLSMVSTRVSIPSNVRRVVHKSILVSGMRALRKAVKYFIICGVAVWEKGGGGCEMLQRLPRLSGKGEKGKR